MIDWFLLAIVSNILFGVQSFLYKYGMNNEHDKFELTFSFTFTASLLSLILFLFSSHIISYELVLILGGLYGLFYFLKTIGQMKALKKVPSNVVFPITSSSVALVVILAVFVLNESLTLVQSVGIALAISVIIAFYARTDNNEEGIKGKYKAGVIIAILAMIFSASASFTNKIAAMLVNKGFFIFAAYSVTALLSFFLFKSHGKHFNKETLKLGSLIGSINFVGYYSLLTALSAGPLSIISPIVGLSFLSTIILGYFIYKERITAYRVLLIVLSIIAAVLLRI